MTYGTKPRIVIVGAGFGGLAVAQSFRHVDADITLIDRQNHHLFQPLLYQVATAGLSPADIAWPVRYLMRRQPNTRVLMGEIRAVDPVRKVVTLDAGPIAYDCLVLATGATHGYFGRDEWARYAPGLKTLDDATAMRRRLLLAFERAEMTSNPEENARLLTIVIVGGGPTGVELAGAVAELARRALARDFRSIDPRRTRVILVEAGPRLLANFPDSLSRYTGRALEQLGVEVRLGQAVTHCDADGVRIGDETLRAGTVVWAAGVAASPPARWLGVAADRAGRVPVTPQLRAPGLEDVWVIGDAALAKNPDGAPQPGIAPVAKQQGRYVARAIAARIEGRAPPPPFEYRDRGLLATIGRKSAVIAWGRLRLRGWIAWWIWGAAHVYFLVSLRNRVIVVTQWLWSYVFFERGARLITGTDAGHTD
ncbi:MAG TPA: NAD(P)/FAD-dependent oxidoreductase [Steroidobacteraceae bacterium]|nr:NAD(P)/FAD-dependent oxidoreductase [Steroidobacteraceae bacterium]